MLEAINGEESETNLDGEEEAQKYRSKWPPERKKKMHEGENTNQHKEEA